MNFVLGIIEQVSSGGGGGSGFPTIVDNIFNEDNSSPSTITMPATVVANDLLIILAVRTSGVGGPSAAPSGWTEFLTDIGYYKWATGTEGGTSVTIPVTGSGPPTVSFTVLRIQGADSAQNPQGSLEDEFNTATFNPPALDPSWADANNLFIVGALADLVVNASVYPTGYTLHQQENDSSSGTTIIAAKQSTSSASENPAAFTLSGTPDGNAVTIAVKGT